MLHKFLVPLLTLLGVLLVGCERHKSHVKDSGQRATDFPTNVTAYQVKGVLKELRAGGAKALITHEDIPGYMEAMTMQLDVRNTNELAGIQPGDQLAFRLLVTDTDGWIDHVKKIGTTTLPVAPPDTNGVLQVQEIKPGALLPDFILTNHLGQAFHLSDFKGRALAFTFIFTRCPFPTFCPRMNNNMGVAQSQLQTDQSKTNWHLISISFDSDYDTPARLAEYAKYYHPDPTHWTFATGTTETIRKLGGGFGLTFWREGALFSHNVRTVVVDITGHVQKVFTDNEWQPEELVEAMKAAMKAAMQAKP